MKITSPVERLSGVGPVIARGLNAMGIYSIGDLIDYYPRRWEYYQNLSSISQIKPGLVCFEASLERIAMRRSLKNKRLKITEAILSDTTGTVRAVWFNQPYLLHTLSAHKSYRFRGNYEFKNGYVSLQNPTFELPGSSEDVRSVLPIYPETKQISSQLIRKLIKGCRDSFEEVPDVLPAEVIKQHSLLNKSEALRALHFADSLEQIGRAHV